MAENPAPELYLSLLSGCYDVKPCTYIERRYNGPAQHIQQPKQTFCGIGNPLSMNPPFSLERSAATFIKERLNIDDGSIKFRKSVSSTLGHNAIFDQAHDGIPFCNAMTGVSLNLRYEVIAFGSSIVKLDPARIVSSKPTISLEAATKSAEDTLDGKVLKQYYLGYLAKEDGSAVLTYVFVVMDAAISRRLKAFVDAHSGCLVSIEDLVINASLNTKA